MWHLTACKISVNLSFLNWIKNEMDFYFFFLIFLFLFFFNLISELMLPTLIQRYDKNYFIFQFKNARLSDFLQAVRCHIL